MEEDVRLQKKKEPFSYRMLPPSPNWYLSSICDISSTGILAWGASKTIPLLDGSNRKDYRFLGEILSHRSYVCCVCFGRFFKGQEFLVSVGDDKRIVVSDFMNRKPVVKAEFTIDAKPLCASISFHKEGAVVIIGFQNGMLLVWDPQTNVKRLKTRLKEESITALKASPHDHDTFIAGFFQGSIALCNLDGKILRIFSGHKCKITSLSWKPNSREPLFCAGSAGGCVRVWNTSDSGAIGSTQFKVQSNRKKASTWVATQWLPSKQILASSLGSSLLYINSETFQIEHSSPKTTGNAFCICLNERNPAFVFTVYSNRRIACWNVMNQKLCWNLFCIGGNACGFDFAPWNPDFAIIGCSDKIRTWRIADGASANAVNLMWRSIKNKVMDVKFHPELENYFVFCTDKGQVQFQHLTGKTGNFLAQHRKIVYQLLWLKRIEFDPKSAIEDIEDEGWRVLSISGDGAIFESNPLLSKKAKRIDAKFGGEHWTSITYMEGKGFALGTLDGCVRIFDDEYEEMHVFEGQKRLVSKCRWNPDSDGGLCSAFLACSSDDQSIVIYDTESSDQVAKFTKHTKAVCDINWKVSDPSILISGGADSVIYIWNVLTSQHLAAVTVHHGRVFSVRWSPSKPHVFYSSSDDGTFREVDLLSGNFYQRIEDKRSKGFYRRKGGVSVFKTDGSVEDLLSGTFEENEAYKAVTELKDTLMRRIRNQHAKSTDSFDALISRKALLSVWKGDLHGAIASVFQSMKGQVHPFWLSLSPALGKNVWEDLIEFQVQRYCYQKQYNVAVMMLLALGDRTEQAIDIYIEGQRFQEALALAVNRYEAEDPIFRKIYKEWALHHENQQEYVKASKCWIRIGDMQKAMEVLTLERSIGALQTVYKLAKMMNHHSLPDLKSKLLILLLEKEEWDLSSKYSKTLTTAFQAFKRTLLEKRFLEAIESLCHELKENLDFEIVDLALKNVKQTIQTYECDFVSIQLFGIFFRLVKWLILSSTEKRQEALAVLFDIAKYVETHNMFILMPCIKEHISNTLMGWQSDIAESLFSDWTKLVEVYDSVLAQEKVEDWGNIDESLHILNILSTTERSEASLKGWNILTFCSEFEPQLKERFEVVMCELLLRDILDEALG